MGRRLLTWDELIGHYSNSVSHEISRELLRDGARLIRAKLYCTDDVAKQALDQTFLGDARHLLQILL